MQARTLSQIGRLAGFTLIELMVVVVIASILLAVAVPSYMSSVRKARRTDAKTALLDFAGREESYMATMNAYTATGTNIGYAALPANVGSNYYALQAPVVAAATAVAPAFFSETALPVAGNGQDLDTTCASFYVDSTGKQSAKNSAGIDTTQICWQQ